MDRKKVDFVSAQNDIDQLCVENRLKRKPRKNSWPELERHLGEILAWARANRSSKRKVARLVHIKLGLQASSEQIYRFVKHANNGQWPHPRKPKEKK